MRDKSSAVPGVCEPEATQSSSEKLDEAQGNRVRPGFRAAAGAQQPGGPAFQAVQRYTDSLHVATEHLIGPQTVAELDQADHYLPGLTAEPAWPTLRAHLLTVAAETGKHPLRQLLTAAAGGDIRTASDMAAVVDWRLTALTPTDPGPLPWLPGIPPTLQADPVWGDYLARRSQLVTDLAGQVQDHVCQGDGRPGWAAPGSNLSTALVREIAVWRAANGIDPQDPRPTGDRQLEAAAAAQWNLRLDRHIAHVIDLSGNARFNERQAAHTVRRRHDDSRGTYQTPGPRPKAPGALGR